MNRQALAGRVVAITGAARGIGLATAEVLLGFGAKVAIGDIDGALAAQVASDLGAGVAAFTVDVTDEESFAAFVAAAEAEFGPLDVLVNNAGIMPIGPLLEESHQVARRALDINVSGPLIGMKAVLPGMIARGRGHVINVASVAGKAPVPGGITYAASKAAIVSMTESARVEFAGKGVRFTCVMPSFTNTDLISGTAGTKVIRTAQPRDVGVAIAKVIARPKPDVFVPGVLAPIVKSQPLLGRAVRDRVNRALGADRVFLDFDTEQRKSYTERIAGAHLEAVNGAAPRQGSRPRSTRAKDGQSSAVRRNPRRASK